MKQLILPLLLLFGIFADLQAQECAPDLEGIPDTASGVFPLPFIADERPDGGIADTAFLNKPFDYTFTIRFTSDTLTVGVVTGAIQRVALNPTGAVTYDPPLTDFSYVCDPPNCTFEADSVGCVKIFGTVTNPDEVGRHELKLAANVTFTVSGVPITLPLTFPNEQIAEVGGNYYLFVKLHSGTFGAYVPDIEVNNRPNPFSEFTQIRITSREVGDFELRVMDMLGQVVRRQRLNLAYGENIIDFDGRDLSDGLSTLR